MVKDAVRAGFGRRGFGLGLGLALALLLAAGCATSRNGPYDSRDGWRVGEVLRIGNGAGFGTASVDCRGAIDASAQPATRFAYVQLDFRRIGRKYPAQGTTQRFAIVPVPPGQRIAPGDDIHLNVRDCSLPITPVTGGGGQAD